MKSIKLYLWLLLLLISINVSGQCVNSPTVTLSKTTGTTCGTASVTVSGNTFGGSATRVYITENGQGSVSPTSASSSPFSFTYTPKSGDIGKTVIITVTTNNPLGSPCVAATRTFTLTVSAIPSAPSIGTITHPTCVVQTGSVALSGLPSSGTWTLTRTPDGVTSTGIGINATVSDIPAGTYTYKVSNSSGCISSQSSSFTIKVPPAVPGIPEHTIDCSLGSGEAVVRVTNPTGTGLTYRLDNGEYQSSTTFSHVKDGNHTITVRNSAGCTAAGSSFVVDCKCLNPAIVILSSTSGSTCINTSLTVTGNTFGGSATGVTITENGAGTVSPVTADRSPFAFTYTPAAGDAGKNVIISVKGNNPDNLDCETTVTYTLSVTDKLPAPVVGTITQPSCILSTGSVVLTGLPSAGTWSLRRLPDGSTITGSGSAYTVTGLLKGSYTFIVTNQNGCASNATMAIVINEQPAIPSTPVIGTITPPTCALPEGSLVISGLPATGQWILTRFPGTIKLTGSGATVKVSGLPSGTYNFTVTNAAGCISMPSQNVIIPAKPENPSPPVIVAITQPTYLNPKGSVFLNGLPTSGSWILIRKPDGSTVQGSGTTITINDLIPGVYTFSVTNSIGCTSSESGEVVIINLDIPVVKITDPAKVCEPATVDIAAPGITEGSTPGLIFTYWKDAGATIQYGTPGKAVSGTYYIKGTNLSGYSDIKPVTVSVIPAPFADAGNDQVLEYKFETKLDAELEKGLTGIWSLVAGKGELFDNSNPKTSVTDLSVGDNIFMWTVTNDICPPALDSVTIKVNDLIPPSLLTPNMDGKNDYFILEGVANSENTELMIFDRWGVQVYKNENYDNSWNGVDFNGKPLPDDTYFYSIKTYYGSFVKGFIVIRK